MKKINLLISFGFILVLFGFKSSNKPMDLAQVNQNLYVDKFEVSNSDWLDYVNFLKENKGDYKSALPDTTVWSISGKINEPFIQYYFRHPAYKRYPVVGVSYEQAIKYCDWRTKHNNENLKFRLPTKSEWIELSKLDVLDKDKKEIKKPSNKYIEIDGKLILGNFKWDSKQKDENELTAPVDSYYPNSKGIYNLFGNLSEMVSEKGIAMGGDYETLLSSFKPDYSITYDKPTRAIGFRCVAEKLK
jgi:formylglycine-generating enzyme required for sulfatase activity